DMRIAREEVFGPVMTVQKWSHPDEAIAMANATEYGLTAAIFARDIGVALDAADRVEAGVVNINGAKMHFVGAPFGGVKNSGLGGEESLEELLSYTHAKAVHITL
ncbi:MAG: aldehyde dehydrogenase family protein, partial [Phenylobacterium sp.]|nr:aldehyde dehydrogenase family protein [Phenylobacterium sp.]